MTPTIRRGFASDNNAGLHPLMIEAITMANAGHVVAYGDDEYTQRAVKIIKKHFGEEADPYFVLTGTGANVLSLASVTRSFNSVICAETAHINVDECGAPEKFTGCKLISVPVPDGKLTPEKVKMQLHGFGFEHHAQPGVISISQPTEMGTVYSVGEIRKLAALAHNHGMFLHMDGARLANAAVSLDKSFKEFTTDAGVDMLSFGGTKNGMLFGESVVFLKPGLSGAFKYLRKQAMQLASKMRFVGAQFEAYLEKDIWRINAMHANKMARLLYEKASAIKGIRITQPVQANAVFAIIPHDLIPVLQKEYFFYVWDESTSEVRWMTSFDTTAEDIENFTSFLASIMSGRKVQY
jgi:threonine aldolase